MRNARERLGKSGEKISPAFCFPGCGKRSGEVGPDLQAGHLRRGGGEGGASNGLGKLEQAGCIVLKDRVIARAVVAQSVAADGIWHDDELLPPVLAVLLIGTAKTLIPGKRFILLAEVREIVTEPENGLEFAITDDPVGLLPLST